MRRILVVFGMALFFMAIFSTITQESVPQEVSSKLIGAGIFYCGGNDVWTYPDTCDRNSEGVWKCGPYFNRKLIGWGSKRIKSVKCGASCTGTGSDHDTNCPE